MLILSILRSGHALFLLALFLSTLAWASSALAAENITWPGNGILRTEPIGGTDDSLFPDDQSGNTVTVNSGTVPGHVHGGTASDPGVGVNDNKVFINGGTVGGDAIGGASKSGTATGNSLVVNGGLVEGAGVGGNSETGAVTDNSVTINNGIVQESVHGGYSLSGEAARNSVIINGGRLIEDAVGGASDFGAVTGNSLILNGGVVEGDVLGGASDSRTVSGNSVVINQGTLEGGAIGGNTFSGAVTGNSVTVNGGILQYNVHGGYSLSGDVGFNNVIVNGGTVDGDAIGGASDFGSSTGNSVTVKGGTVTGEIIGGSSDAGVVAQNSVVISGGTVQNKSYGGFSNSGTISHNSITVNGGIVLGDIHGGFSNTGTITDNTMTISGRPNLSAAGLYGGLSLSGPDDFTGNTLNVVNYSGGSVRSLQNFQNYNFVLPASMTPGGVVLPVSGTVILGDGKGTGSTVTGISSELVARPFQPGETITLIGASSLSGSLANTTLQGQHGMFLIYDWNLLLNGNNLDATLAGAQLAPQTKALSEGYLTGLILSNQGADLAAGQGMSAARHMDPREGTGKATVFGIGSGSTSRYDTGSHVDVDGFSLITGVSWNDTVNDAPLMFGAFFEAGWGSYDSHNSFDNAASVKGNGDTNYMGGGILGRYDFFRGLYTEASARMGRVENDFSTNDLRDGMGNNADYNSDSLYYGVHAGLGYIWQLNELANVDLYTKVLWTHQDGDTVNVGNGSVDFEDADSLRWRGGARLSYIINDHVTPYAGVAYEYEFDGEAKASIYGYPVDAPDLEGPTGMGEVGLSIQPNPNSGFSMDLAAQGYTGMRQGVGGSLHMKWEF